MKVTVKVGGRTFEVEVGDVHTQPIVATIDGERFEVWIGATDAFGETDKRIQTDASAAPI